MINVLRLSSHDVNFSTNEYSPKQLEKIARVINEYLGYRKNKIKHFNGNKRNDKITFEFENEITEEQGEQLIEFLESYTV